MVKANLRKERKVTILAEYMRLFDNVCGKLPYYGAMKIILQRFAPFSRATVYRIVEEHENHGDQTDFTSKRFNRCGRKSKLTEELRETYVQILTEYSRLWIRCTTDIWRSELEDAGFPLSRSTVQFHLKLLNRKKVNLKIKPSLSPIQTEDRLRFILSQVDRTHGVTAQNHRFKNQFNTVHVSISRPKTTMSF